MVKISKQVLEDILLTAREVYPNEFVGILKAENGVISQIHIIPGSSFSKFSASYRRDMMTIDLGYIGTVHSHPTQSYTPSQGDLKTFSSFGRVHIIVKYPFQSEQDLACYDRVGNKKELEVEESETSESV